MSKNLPPDENENKVLKLIVLRVCLSTKNLIDYLVGIPITIITLTFRPHFNGRHQGVDLIDYSKTLHNPKCQWC